MQEGFDARRCATFRATRCSLSEALPGWRTFTVVDKLQWQPEAPVPSRLPFDHVLLPRGAEDWEARWLELDYALSGERVGPMSWDATGDVEWSIVARAMRDRELDREPLSRGGDGLEDPRWVLAVPSRLTKLLAELSQGGQGSGRLGELASRWDAGCPSGNDRDHLVELADLARRAIERKEEIFVWLCHTTLR
jgi:hypothetical protein